MQVQLQVKTAERWEPFCNRTFPNMDDACEWFRSIKSHFKTRMVPRHSSRWVSGITIEERTWEIVRKSKRPRKD
jgi:hypothetical protein